MMPGKVQTYLTVWKENDMKISELVLGEKYQATCFGGKICTFLSVYEMIDSEHAVLSVEYGGKLYLATPNQLYIERR